MRKNLDQQHSTEQTYHHYKMYKAGKRWVYAGIITLSLGLSVAVAPEKTKAATEVETPAVTAVVPEVETSEVPETSETPKMPEVSEAPEAPETPETPEPSTEQKPEKAPEPAGDLTETYDGAKTQTDQANAAADEANQSLADLQALLADPDLTATAGWQDKLQDQLAQFQTAVDAFGAEKENTDATVAEYQAAIDAVIASKPNAVETVTQGTETTGQTLADYDTIVTDYQQQVAMELQKITDQAQKYGQVQTVNTAQTELQAAAEVLNAKIKAAQPGDDLTDLQKAKATYDIALEAYNTAVSAYDDSQVIHQNADDETDETKNPADATFDQLVDYLNTKPAYDTANQAYQATADQVAQTQVDLEAWQQAVKAYQTALDQVRGIDITQLNKADATAMTTAKKTIIENATDLETAQEIYLSTDAENDGAVKTASDKVNEAIKALNESVATYQDVYEAYQEAVDTQAKIAVNEPVDLTTPQQAVLDAQTKLTTSVAKLQESQMAYQTALANYQASLDEAQVDLKASDSMLSDLTELNDGLTEQFNANEAVMAIASKLPAVKQTETKLQQRINQINGLSIGINHNQEVWQAISDAAAATNTWAHIATSLQTIGDNALAATERYKAAIVGTDAVSSYEALVADYERALTDYNEIATSPLKNSYAAPDQLATNLKTFSDEMATFDEAFQNLLTSIASNVPNEVNNEQAKESMQTIENLSTDGSFSGTIVGIRRFAPIVVWYEGLNLSGFINNDDVIDLNEEGGLELPTLYPKDLTLVNEAGEPTTKEEVVEGQKYYLQVSDSVLGELEVALRRNLPAAYVGENGKLYRLTGLIVPGNMYAKDGSPIDQLAAPTDLSDFYTFTTTDPISELMGMFKGFSTYAQNQPSFKFYYVADDQNVKQVTDSTGTTKNISKITLPSVETIQDLTNTETDLAVATKGGLPIVSAPNEVEVPTAMTYLSGAQISTDLTLGQIDQAPILTLNKVTQPTTPTDPTDTLEPDTDPVPPIYPSVTPEPETEPTDPTEVPDSDTDPTDPDTAPETTDPAETTDPDIDPTDPRETPKPDTDPIKPTITPGQTTASNVGSAEATSIKTGYQVLATGHQMSNNQAITNPQLARKVALQATTNQTTTQTDGQTLPQTGEKADQRRLSILGTILLSVATLFGFGGKVNKRRQS